MKTLKVFEFDCIDAARFEQAGLGQTEARRAFRTLRALILPEQSAEEAQTGDIAACMKLGSRRGEEVIFVRNYVGTISLSCGVQIEILPKLGQSGADEKTLRALVIEMLRACGALPPRKLSNADLGSERLTVFELYICVFLNEVEQLCRRGLRAGYVPYEGNENVWKGKLNFAAHARLNYAHAERFYVQYDLFDFDRAENKLIKSTLLLLRRISHDPRNISDINHILMRLSEISPSENYEADFARCAHDRSVKDYETVMRFCRVFLRGKSFSVYAGREHAFALLFPMEKLYEKYIAREMGRALSLGWRLKEQSKEKSLFEREFVLQPDLLLQRGETRVIVDTKWKMLNGDANAHYGISQADMYQMYAYHTRYRTERVVLLYPYTETARVAQGTRYCSEVYGNRITVLVAFFDLLRYFKERKPFFECLYIGQESLLPLETQ